MNIRFTVALICLGLISSCATVKNTSGSFGYYDIFGRVEGRENGYIYLQTYDTTEAGPHIDLDSAEVRNSFFHIRGKTRLPMMAKLNLNPGRNLSFTNFFVLDMAVTKVTLFRDSMSSSIIEGSALNDQLLSFNKKIKEIGVAFSETYAAFVKQPGTPKDSLDGLRRSLDRDVYGLVLNEIKSNPHSIVSSFVANREDVTAFTTDSELDQLLNAFNRAENYFVKKIRKEMATMLKTAVGERLPHFKVTDRTGQTLTNRSFKQHYLFLDFWASWCHPCREQNPVLARIYKRFKDENFRMLSISVDADSENWLQAVKADQMKWLQTKADEEGKMEERFGVHFIPYSYLVAPGGRIIVKNLTAEELETKLDSLFNR